MRPFLCVLVFACYFGVGKTLGYNLRDCKVKTKGIIRLAIIETKTLFIEITEKMERFDTNVCPTKRSLQATPKVFDSVCMYISFNVLLGVIDYVVNVLLAKIVVRAKRICIDMLPGFNVFRHLVVKMLSLCSRDNHRANLSVTFEQAHHGNLACGLVSASSRRRKLSNTASKRHLVHVSRLTTDEGFVNFNMSAQLAACLIILQRKSESLEHEPCRLLRDADSSVNLPRANAVLAVSQHPHRTQPLVETDSGVLKNRSDLDRKLRLWMASLALPQSALWHVRNLIRSAVRAHNRAIWPATLNQIVNAVVGIREVNDGFLKCLWFSVSHDGGRVPRDRLRSQVYYYRFNGLFGASIGTY